MVKIAELTRGCDFVDAGTLKWTYSTESEGVEHTDIATPPITVDPRVKFCRYYPEPGSNDAWYSYKIGPFTSTGGVTFRFPFQPFPMMENLPFETIGLQALYQVFTDGNDGPFVDEDRLIAHHQNLWDYESQVDWKWSEMLEVDVPGPITGMYQPPTMQPGTRGEHWGVATPEDCPFCYYEDWGAEYAKPLSRGPKGYPFVTDGYCVDKREEGAPEWTWYYQVGFKFVEGAKPTVQLLSEHQMWNPSNVHATVSLADQSLFYLFSHEDHFLYFTGRWPVAGTLYARGSYLHVHPLHKESYLFNAPPESAGLGTAPFDLKADCLPTPTKETWAGNNSRVVGVLKETCPSCFGGKLICEVRDGRSFCKDWHFNKGDVFTSLSFFGGSEPIGHEEAQHIVWFMRYVADEGVSPLTWQIYTDTLDKVPLVWEASYIDFSMFYASFPPPLAPETKRQCAPINRDKTYAGSFSLARGISSLTSGYPSMFAAGLAGVLVMASRMTKRAELL